MENRRTVLRDLVLRHCAAPRRDTAIDGLTLFNGPAPTEPRRSLYDPRLCVVVQGGKRVILGATGFDVGPSQFLVATLDLPVTAFLTEASPDRPHLALTLRLDRARVADVRSATEVDPTPRDGPLGLAVGSQTEELLDAVVRLLRLLDEPADVAVIRPMVEREIVYRLLRGPMGSVLAGFAGEDPHLAQVGRATDWIRTHYDEPLRIDELASRAGMSATSLHRHFKAITSMTPLEYRREIRLGEARRRILTGTSRAGDVALSIGYDSVSQFNREYRRSFGCSPTEDARAFRQGGLPASGTSRRGPAEGSPDR